MKALLPDIKTDDAISVMWNQFPMKNLQWILCLFHLWN